MMEPLGRAILQRLVTQLTVLGLLLAFAADILLGLSLSQTAYVGGNTLFIEGFRPSFAWNIVTVAGCFSVFLGGVLSCALGDFKRIGGKYLAAFCLLQCWMMLHAINTFWDGFTPFEPFTFKGPAVWWACFIIFTGTDERRWQILRKVLVGISFASCLIILGVICTSSFADRYEAMRSLYGYIPSLFWTAPWVLLLFSDSIRLGLAYLPFAVMAMSSVFIATRSWMIICLLYLLSFFAFKGRKTRAAKGAGAVSLVIILIIGATFFSDKLSAALDVINARGFEDTRSEQYEQFFRQVSVSDLVVGKGPRGTYRLGRRDYGSIDGSYTLMAFNGGVILVVTYVTIFLIPAALAFRSGRDPEVRASALVLLFWGLALTGFSIYSVPDISTAHYILSLYAGRCLGHVKRQAGLPVVADKGSSSG